MIEYVQNGDMFASGCEALVNPVNCVSVMGKGVALECKKRFPKVFIDYQYACRKGLVKPGTVFPVKIDDVWVVNFATKDHWRDPSKLEWIDHGLGDLRRWIRSVAPDSVAVPPLGCGLGGLKWGDVKPLIELRLGDLTTRIVVFEPNRT